MKPVESDLQSNKYKSLPKIHCLNILQSEYIDHLLARFYVK